VVQGLLANDAEFRRVHDENLRRGRAFQEEFGRRPGVTSLPNGIQYEVLRAGTGPSPGADDVVVVSYRALLLDGTVVGQGESREVRVGSTIPGAAAALQKMNAGARWRVALPPELAHGSAGRYPDVGANETLFGEIELVEIKPRS
jgi:FKBP-type peptidyl-prolyl cis-trans isomerase FklB